MFNININNNNFYCKEAEGVFVLIKQFVDNNFWDDVINDEVGQDIEMIDKWYKPADLLKNTDKKYYDELCKEFWEECKQDVLDEINDIKENQINTIYGFEVSRVNV